MSLRKTLGDKLSMQPGPDLGTKSSAKQVELLPAYERYAGIVYRGSGFRTKYSNRRDGFDVLIISALYGVLHPTDLIRDYELRMQDQVDGLGRVGTWWRRKSLSEIFSELIDAINPSVIHDLLPLGYRSVVQPSAKKGIKVVSYEFPGQGSGSNYRRVEILERLLADNLNN
jgi:cytoplasmic iron level regulating protein YaaA (DUF328/UPF0246 family)